MSDNSDEQALDTPDTGGGSQRSGATPVQARELQSAVKPKSSHSLGPLCPRCGGQRCSRVRRQGLMQMLILPHFGFFPWECGQCRNIFTFKSRGKLKRKRASMPTSPRGPLPSA